MLASQEYDYMAHTTQQVNINEERDEEFIFQYVD
jgi:hypothetical protein